MIILEKDLLHPGLSIDCVIFGFHQDELKVLLLQPKHMEQWALPGGFVGKSDDVDEAAAMVLQERTGLIDIFLKQFYLFGNCSRYREGYAQSLCDRGVIPEALVALFDQRFVTVGYYALVEYSKVKDPKPDYKSETCKWCALQELPEMMLDHRHIIEKAHESLKRELNYQPIGIDLLPELFTMPELQKLYETVLERRLDRRNFRRKILSYNILIATDQRRTGGAHKAPMLYRFDREKYAQAMASGLGAGWQ